MNIFGRLIAFTLLAGIAVSATASSNDPIHCQSDEIAVKNGDSWECIEVD